MQAYGSVFASVYERQSGAFARQAAPAILAHYEAAAGGAPVRTLLDLCCGTGELARYFLDHGYRVVGVDLSEAMLVHARARAAVEVAAGRAAFRLGDAAAFTLDAPVGLAVATYDALNHLADLEALARCFACVHAALRPGGLFVFDLNTRRGLLERWNHTFVQDDGGTRAVWRGVYDGGGRAVLTVSGEVRSGSGAWEPFEETVYNTAFDLAAVRAALAPPAWAEVRFAQLESLATRLAAPEDEGRVFVVARTRG